MSIDRRILAIIGARFPAVYDLSPRGPLGYFNVHNRFSELNPQPLPPHELGAAIAAEFTHTAWQAERFGLDQSIAFTDLEDWCPTYPRIPKRPSWWGPSPHPDPVPGPDWHVDFHLGFAARLAWAAGQTDSPTLRESFDKAIERSIAAIESNGP
jgi:hypothetical protein